MVNSTTIRSYKRTQERSRRTERKINGTYKDRFHHYLSQKYKTEFKDTADGATPYQSIIKIMTLSEQMSRS